MNDAHVLLDFSVDRFDEHDGPVRGIHFHESQPLFVSGGRIPQRRENIISDCSVFFLLI